jgi:hypothetical protein
MRDSNSRNLAISYKSMTSLTMPERSLEAASKLLRVWEEEALDPETREEELTEEALSDEVLLLLLKREEKTDLDMIPVDDDDDP